MFKDDRNLLNRRFIVMSLLSFSGFLRFQEVVNLKRNNISLKEKQMKIFIPVSKTGQNQKRQPVVIARTAHETCPLQAMELYLKLSKIPVSSNDFLFRRICFCKKLDTYSLRNGGPISYTRARELLLESTSKNWS